MMSFVCVSVWEMCKRIKDEVHGNASQYLFPFNFCSFSMHLQFFSSSVFYRKFRFGRESHFHSIKWNLRQSLLHSMDVPMIYFHRLMSQQLGSFLMEISHQIGIGYFLRCILLVLLVEHNFDAQTKSSNTSSRKYQFLFLIPIRLKTGMEWFPCQNRIFKDASELFLSPHLFFPCASATTTTDWILIKFSI